MKKTKLSKNLKFLMIIKINYLLFNKQKKNHFFLNKQKKKKKKKKKKKNLSILILILLILILIILILTTK